MFNPILKTGHTELRQAIEKLIAGSRTDIDFYFMLSISTLIVTLGLLEGSIVILIGGMILAPLLSPLLGIGLAITTASGKSLKWIITHLLKALGFVIFIALIVAFLFASEDNELINSFHPNLNLFLIAFAAGAGAAYAWVRPNLSPAIPGIAITVSLLPPLAATAIGIRNLSSVIISESFALFFINLLGIILASIVIFLMFGFGTLQAEEEKIIRKEEAEEQHTQEEQKNNP
ncbi:MAG: hypothetical protein ACD_81C00114G0010 [uncultured bacterium]|uniref:TIGR00341 family protein n=1 Tax=Candidatus Wolfebacteria bacterium GW2011_GWE2_44_13 TaxID=1619017 RepID=A0A0G1H8B9_9BACT|nr:MAG: hypothetical protein ACD_81C00114G0010 [uncultured bacterium]KKT43611.1 MAG: hypothetical protein UW32_C0001G0203 [Candidatus Wolfebacteria bacterium GW2011_GWE2_44_13]